MLPRAPRAALLALSLAALGAPAARAADSLTMETLAPGVYAFRPTSEAFEAWRAISNSGAVVLEDGLLLYDSHLSPALVDEALAKLRAVTDKPLRYVVHSHFHGDHVGGAWAYGRGVEVISHAWTRERLLRYYADLPEVLPKRIADHEKSLAAEQDPARRARATSYLELDRALLARVNAHAPVPNSSLTFDSKVMLHRGREVQVFFLGRGHTGGDAVLFLPDAKVAFLGDLLFTRTLPNVGDGYTKEWISTLEKTLLLGAERFVAGHGPVSTAADVRGFIDYLKWLRGAVEPFVRAGKGLEEAKKGVTLPEAYKDYAFGQFFPSNVEKVYGELKEGR